MKSAFKISALALLLSLSFSLANAGEPVVKKKPAQVAETLKLQYAGVQDDAAMFYFQFSNSGLEKPTLVVRVKTKTTESAFTDVLDGKGCEKLYKVDAAEPEDTVVFDVYDGDRKVYSQTFHMSELPQ
jgi:hypothetical protein